MCATNGSLQTFNDNWATPWTGFLSDELREVSSRAGAFPLAEGSRDAAVLLRALAGTYSIFVANLGDESQIGAVLVEVYDVTDR